MVFYLCNCGWTGRQDKRKCVTVSSDDWYFVCPKCGNKELTKLTHETIKCPECGNIGMDFEDVSYYYSEKRFVGSITELPHEDYKVTCHKCHHVIQWGNLTH